MNTSNKIRPRLSSLITSVLVVLSAITLVLAVMPNFAQDYGNTAAPVESNPSTREEIRQVLTEMLASEQQDDLEDDFDDDLDEDDAYDQTLIEDWQESKASLLGEQLARLIRKIPDYPEDFSTAFRLSASPDIGWSLMRVFLTIALTVFVGLLVEQFTISKLLNRLYAYVDTKEKTTGLKYKFIFIRIMIQLIGVAVLAVVTYAAAFYFRNQNPYFELMFSEVLGALVMLRLWMILLRSIFSPSRPTLRPVPLDDQSARQLHLWFTFFFIIIEFGDALFKYLIPAGVSEAQLNGLLIPYTLSLNLIILSRIWVMRGKITGMFVAESGAPSTNNIAQNFLHVAWPFIFTAWLMTLWALWLYKAFLGQWADADYVSISWWITLAFFVADRMFYGAIKNVTLISWLHSPTFEIRSQRFIRVVQNGFRLLMIAVAVYMVSRAWGLSTNALMQSSFSSKFFEQGINLLVIATITYIVWEFFNALIERSLPEEMDAIAALEGEGGGAGATRAETLLPLMRTCLSVILFSFVLLSVLHSLGIAIAPLLAGAGVVGIAIGFGAQKLVQDVLSGIFFLVDDAFRKNEYIEIEDLRGTVEKISLRSMQLRHHLGAVQTIPYGEIKTVKNLSRDWITMKLELRLSYDTDIEQVRKIIKKVGQEMLQDEELGPSFILPLKSQGVMRIEESALIVRMKFTTKPGEQWVIRREAFRKVRDALSAGGIFFAHREVRVRLPDDQIHGELSDSPEMKQALSQAGAAAGASVAADEASKKGKIDYENEM